ncbi:MAG TPA: HAMP domain-containing sensor histidine kinase [Puia sp.]|jgi:signal transduction histidine kinase
MRLNNKTIRNYLFYCTVIFLLTIPVLYLVMGSLLQHSVDHSLRTQLKEIRSNVNQIRSEEDMKAWSRLDKDISLAPATVRHPDSVYSINRFNTSHREDEPFREIAGIIQVEHVPYEIIIRSSLIENEDLLGSILLVQVTVLVILIGGILWMNHKVSKRLWSPFYVALRNIQSFELNKQSELEFRDSSTDEFNELNKALKMLIHRNSEIYLQQKEFTENAAHEMQTPLAILQSKLELLMQTSSLTEQQAELINAMDETNRRIVRLNKSLLLLAKIENRQYDSIESVSLESLCQRILQQFQLHTDEMDIEVAGKFQPNARVQANPQLLDILVSNLLSNAIRYNRTHGQIFITAENESLTVENTGANFALDPDRIFERFQKQSNNTGKDEGTGLGLAIVRNICYLYNYQVSYSFAGSWHVFRIDFGG